MRKSFEMIQTERNTVSNFCKSQVFVDSILSLSHSYPSSYSPSPSPLSLSSSSSLYHTLSLSFPLFFFFRQWRCPYTKKKHMLTYTSSGSESSTICAISQPSIHIKREGGTRPLHNIRAFKLTQTHTHHHHHPRSSRQH